MKRVFLVSLLSAGLLPVNMLAQEPAPLDLDLKTAVGMAEKASYTLLGASADLEYRRTAAQTAWSLIYPTASLSGTFQTGLTDPDTPSPLRNKLSAGLSLGLTLTPALAFDVKRLWNEYETGLATYEQARLSLATTVKKYYFGLVLLSQQLDLLRKQTEAAGKRLETAEFKFKNGFLSEIDKLTVEFAYKDRLYALQIMENAYDSNMRQLKDVCGIETRREVNLTASLPDLAAFNIETVPGGLEHNPELKLLAFSKSQAEIQRDLAAAALWPTVSVSGRTSGGYSADPVADNVWSGASWAWAGSLSLSVGVTVPLDAYLPYSQTRRTLAAQQAAVDKVSYSISDRVQALKRQVDGLRSTLVQIRTQIDALLVNIALAERNLNLTEQLYAAGKKSFLDLKDAENSLYQAQVQLLAARNNYLSAVLDLEYLSGADLGL